MSDTVWAVKMHLLSELTSVPDSDSGCHGNHRTSFPQTKFCICNNDNWRTTLSMLNGLFLYKPTGFRSSSKQNVLMSVLKEAGRIPTARVQVFVLSGDDASERVERQRETFGHVLAQPRVSLLTQTVFGPHRLLDAVAGVQARGHLDAAKSHMGTVSHLEWVNFRTKVFFYSLRMVYDTFDVQNRFLLPFFIWW